MNILELQVRIAISGVHESGPGPTLLDWKGPVLDGLSTVPRLPALTADVAAQADRDANPRWPGAFV